MKLFSKSWQIITRESKNVWKVNNNLTLRKMKLIKNECKLISKDIENCSKVMETYLQRI